MWTALVRAAATRPQAYQVASRPAARALSSASTSQLADIQARAKHCWDAILDSHWIDSSSISLKTEAADGVVRDYRSLYDATAVETSVEAREVYQAVEQLYTLKEAAKIVELYSDHIKERILRHMEHSGFLGNNTSLPPEDVGITAQTLREYIDFVNSIENNRIRRKVEAQLGQKAIQLRQVVSADNFSATFMPVATDHIVTSLKARPVKGTSS